ncbi:TPA: hypothetical protein ACGHXV_003537 [Salmonella enterica subsp. enterica serovar Adelaide]
MKENQIRELVNELRDIAIEYHGTQQLRERMARTVRAAMLQGSQPVSNRDELQVIGWLRSDYNSDDKRDHNAPLFMLGSNDPSEAWGVKYIPLSGNSPVIPEDLRRAFEAVARLNNEMYCWTSCMSYNGSYNGEPEGLLKRNIREIEHIMDSCRAAMLQANQRDLSQPVDPQVAEYEKIMLQAGWVMVPVETTDEMIVAAMDSDDVTYNESDDTVFYVHHREIYKAMLAAAPKPEAGPCTK